MIRHILFDAVGTLIYPQPSVAEIYEAVGRRFGSSLTIAEIRPRFTAAYCDVFRNCADLSTNEARERQRWQAVVAQVFAEPPASAEAIFAELWQHFAEPQHWAQFDDVAAVWPELTARGFVLGIASNFDARLRRILAGHELLADCPHVFISTELGYAKPGPGFYREIEQRLGARPEEILIVGDDLENDVYAPRRAGWQAIALSRRGEHRDQELDAIVGSKELLLRLQ